MAIKGPKNATPTLRGWVSSKGELLKAQKISQAQLDEYFGAAPVAAPAPQLLTEAEPTIELPVEPTEELLIDQTLFPIDDPVDVAPKSAAKKTKIRRYGR